MKVLLVDDHPMVRRGFKDGLESTFEEDNEIFEAGFVDDAIEVFNSDTFDVAVLDLRLGEGSSLESHGSLLRMSFRCAV